MELITLKEASRITSLSYSYLFIHKSELGFFKPLGKGKWLADKKLLELKIKGDNNSDRLTSVKEEKCQSKNVVTHTTLTSSRQMARELGDLLERRTKRKPKNTTTS